MRTFWVPFREQGLLVGPQKAVSVATGKQAMIKHLSYCVRSAGPNTGTTGHLGHYKLRQVKNLKRLS